MDKQLYAQLMPQTNTYALGVQALRDSFANGECPLHPTCVIDGKQWIRPLTFAENLLVLANDFNRKYDVNNKIRSKQDWLLQLFKTRLYSCTGIAYKGGTTKFKIIPVCEQLITINQSFHNSFLPLPIDYDSITGSDVVELDGREEGVVYNGARLRSEEVLHDWRFKRKEFLQHPAWNAAVGNTKEGKKILKAYCDIYSMQVRPTNRRMEFYLRRPRNDQLLALCLSEGFYADG